MTRNTNVEGPPELSSVIFTTIRFIVVLLLHLRISFAASPQIAHSIRRSFHTVFQVPTPGMLGFQANSALEQTAK